MKSSVLFFLLSFIFIAQGAHADTTLPINETISSNDTAFTITNDGLGNSGIFKVNNLNNKKVALGAVSNGKTALVSLNRGSGVSGFFANIEETNNVATLLGLTRGLGTTGSFLSSNENSEEPTLIVGNVGQNTAAQIFTLNDMSFQPALEVIYNGLGNAIMVSSEKNGAALKALIKGNGCAIQASVKGTNANQGILATIDDSASDARGILSLNRGLGSAGWFENRNADSTNASLISFSRGKGHGALVASIGGGDGLLGVIPEEATEPTGDFTYIDGLRAAVRGVTSAEKGNAGVFIVDNNDNFNPAVWARHDGPAAALYAENTAGGTSIQAKGDMDINGQGTFFKNYPNEGVVLKAFHIFGSSGTVAEFIGDIEVNGTLYKSSGGFKIDHPLDPENKYLYHSYVESPEMMNVYNGVAILDSKGEASVKLPTYFEKLNKDFRYQLTPIGVPGPNLHIAKEISNNKFYIAGGRSNMKVSWQVTGVRIDNYAKNYRIIPEVEKEQKNRGKYLNPTIFQKPMSKKIGWDEILKEINKQKENKASVNRKKSFQAEWETLKQLIEAENEVIKKIATDENKHRFVRLSTLKERMGQTQKDVEQMVNNLKK